MGSELYDFFARDIPFGPSHCKIISSGCHVLQGVKERLWRGQGIFTAGHTLQTVSKNAKNQLQLAFYLLNMHCMAQNINIAHSSTVHVKVYLTLIRL